MAGVPNLLTFLRILSVPVLLLLAWLGQPSLFLVVLGTALLSDLADGFLARRFRQTTALGTRLDTWADVLLYTGMSVGAWWLWREHLVREAPCLLILLGAYAVPTVAGLVKYGRIPSYHRWGAKVSAVLLNGAALLLFLGGFSTPFRIATAVFTASQIEELATIMVLNRWRSNVPSLWHAMRLKEALDGEGAGGDHGAGVSEV